MCVSNLTYCLSDMFVLFSRPCLSCLTSCLLECQLHGSLLRLPTCNNGGRFAGRLHKPGLCLEVVSTFCTIVQQNFDDKSSQTENFLLMLCCRC